MNSRTIKIKTQDIDHELFIAAILKDGATTHTKHQDNIYIFHDTKNDNFSSIQDACHQLKIPYDCYYKAINEFDHGNWMLYRPGTKEGIYTKNIREPFHKNCIELNHC